MYKRKNLIWIVVDSVRTYKTGLDDRDRLDIMDEFASESIEFSNAITSAPSTILSGAAMFTGTPSCFVSRHFDDWQFDPKVLISIQEILDNNGYVNFGIYNSKEDREVMKDLLRPIPHRYFPKGISHGKWWTNHQVNLILENTLRVKGAEPSFFVLWYDSRNDPMVSDYVKKGLHLFKDFGLYEDSIIVLTSDHGYPDPRTGIIQTRKKHDTRHDLVVTDDNIRVPLFLKYPGCRPRKVDQMIGSIDLLPTLLALLGIQDNDPRMKNVQGINLLPLIEDGVMPVENRVIRTDTRLSLAPGRITSLRTDEFKYVYNYDEGIEALYSLNDDPLETNDLLQSSPNGYTGKREFFQAHLMAMQNQLNLFHIEELKAAFQTNIKKVNLNEIKRLLVLSEAPVIFLEVIIESFREKYTGISIDFLAQVDKTMSEEAKSLFDQIFLVENLKSNFLQKKMTSENIIRYDVSLIIREKSNVDFDDPVVNKAASVLGKKVLMSTYNMKFYNWYIAQWLWPIRKYWRNWEFYKYEPWLVFKDIVKLANNGFKFFILKRELETFKSKRQKDLDDKNLLAEKERLSTKHGTE